MNASSSSNFEKAVNKGLNSGSWRSLNKWVAQNSTFSFKYDGNISSSFDEHIYSKILSLLNNEAFIKSSGSSNVLKILEYDWASLSVMQRDELLVALVRVYADLVDPLSWFLISELLGEYYANAEALKYLKFLKETINDPARSLIPMGFEKLIRYSLSSEIKAEALLELNKMKDDTSEQVRLEVEISYSRLSLL